MSQNDHAERLREMAGPCWTNDYQRSENESAALLAGAEAIEKCEQLREFAEELTRDGHPVLLGFAYHIERILCHGREK
jgi:3-deoxy-D-arabino-heptulosonate 7-phosphate (DAHP) synthase